MGGGTAPGAGSPGRSTARPPRPRTPSLLRGPAAAPRRGWGAWRSALRRLLLRPAPASPRRCPFPRASSSRRGGPAAAALRAGAGIALLAAAALAALPAPAQAQNQLVSNTGQTASVSHVSHSDHLAQPFTTGTHSSGYILSSIGIVSADNHSFSARVCATDDDGDPTSTCTNLTAPSSFSAGTLTFAAPANTTLTANTTYAIRITTSNKALGTTNSNNEDRVRAAGWSIGNTIQARGMRLAQQSGATTS